MERRVVAVVLSLAMLAVAASGGVAELSQTVATPDLASPVASPAATPSSETRLSLRVEGRQTEGTDIYGLSTSLYHISATCEPQRGFGYFQLFLVDAATGDDRIFLIGDAPFSGSTLLQIEEGRYGFNIVCEGAWTLIVEDAA